MCSGWHISQSRVDSWCQAQAFRHSCLSVRSLLLGVSQIAYSNTGLSGLHNSKTAAEKWQTVTQGNRYQTHQAQQTHLPTQHSQFPSGSWIQDNGGQVAAVHQDLLVTTLVLQHDGHKANHLAKLNGDGLDGEVASDRVN